MTPTAPQKIIPGDQKGQQRVDQLLAGVADQQGAGNNPHVG